MSDDYDGDDNAPARPLAALLPIRPAAAIEPLRACRLCGLETTNLHHDPDNPLSPVRCVCAYCQGKANRIHIDRINASARSEVRKGKKGEFQ